MDYFPNRTAAEVTAAVEEAYRAHAGARNVQVIPLLVEHRASKTLRGLDSTRIAG